MMVGHIRGFDGLRAISVILVLVTHLGVFHALPEQQFIRDRIWRLCSGETGVNIFFTLSGFLITRILLVEYQFTGTINLKKFYIRRFLRLTPPFIVFILINIVLSYIGLFDIWWPGLLISFFYLYNFIPTTLYDIHLGHTWSLAVEEQFYVFWPFLIRTLSRSLIYFVMLILIIISTVLLLYLPDIVIPGTRSGIKLNDLFHGGRLLIPALGPIMIGSFFAFIQTSKWIVKLNLIFFSIIFFLFPIWSPGALLEIAPIFQSFGTASMLTWMLLNQQSPLISLLEWNPISYIGRISYGIYLYHVIFMGMGRGAGLIRTFPLDLLVSVVFAIISYEFMERRILRLKDRFR